MQELVSDYCIIPSEQISQVANEVGLCLWFGEFRSGGVHIKSS